MPVSIIQFTEYLFNFNVLCYLLLLEIRSKLQGIAPWPPQANDIFSPRRASEKKWRATE